MVMWFGMCLRKVFATVALRGLGGAGAAGTETLTARVFDRSRDRYSNKRQTATERTVE